MSLPIAGGDAFRVLTGDAYAVDVHALAALGGDLDVCPGGLPLIGKRQDPGAERSRWDFRLPDGSAPNGIRIAVYGFLEVRCFDLAISD